VLDRDAPASRGRGKAARLLGIGGLAIALLLLPSSPRRPIVWNASPSLPLGLYFVGGLAAVDRGTVVAAHLPPAWAKLADDRGYLPRGVPLLKTIAAVTGDRVCAHADRLDINGRMAARRLARDRAGRALPRWSGCLRLGPSQVLLLAKGHSASFDGRYFGPVPASAVIGRARLVWRV
jgi:conjugative transfer signal peptidase TraF